MNIESARCKTRLAFTLLELIMVVLIIAIISVVTIASIANSLAVTRLEAARWRIKSDLSYAQSLAVTQQVNHGVIFDPANETYSVYRQNVSNVVNNPLTGQPFTVNYPTDTYLKGVEVVSAGFGTPPTTRLEFDSFGIPSDGTTILTTDGTIILSYQGNSATITVTKNTGKIN